MRGRLLLLAAALLGRSLGGVLFGISLADETGQAAAIGGNGLEGRASIVESHQFSHFGFDGLAGLDIPEFRFHREFLTLVVATNPDRHE